MTAATVKLVDLLDPAEFDSLRRSVESSGDEPQVLCAWSPGTGYLVGLIARAGGIVHIEAHHCPSRAIAEAELRKFGGELPPGLRLN